MKKQNNYQILIKSIVKEMQYIIGDVAVVQANIVPGLAINNKTKITKNPQIVMKNLIARYQRLMGPVAITIAKKGAQKASMKKKELIIPKILK